MLLKYAPFSIHTITRHGFIDWACGVDHMSATGPIAYFLYKRGVGSFWSYGSWPDVALQMAWVASQR